MEEPFLYKDAQPVQWTLRQVAELVQELISLGCANDLIDKADEQGVFLTAPAETINFVKSYLFSKKLHKRSELAGNVVRSAACIPGPVQPGPPVFPPPGPGDVPPFY